jgi:hypothetical protein
MTSASTVRHHIAEIARRLVGLLDESVAPGRAVQILVAEKTLPTQASDTEERPLAAAIHSLGAQPGIDPHAAERVASYVGACEERGRGESALRLLARLRIRRVQGRTSLGVIGIEFALLMLVLSVHAIFVLPQFEAMFAAAATPMPPFTRLVYALIGPTSPFLYLVIAIALLVLVWRWFSFLLGPLIRPLDRLLLAFPLVGPAIRQNNCDRLSGWVGFAAADAAAQSAAIDAARHWYRGDLLSRACADVAREVASGKDPTTCLARARAFDPAFQAAISIPDREESLAALRARWRIAGTLAEPSSPLAPALTQVAFGLVLGALVIAMYLPIFKLGSLM